MTSIKGNSDDNNYALFADSKLQQARTDGAILNNELISATGEENNAQSNVNSSQLKYNTEKNTLSEYQNLLELTKAKSPLKKMYGGIKEFQIQQASMCNMGTGMSMGSLVESDMKLTGQELLDISNLLKENSGGQFKPSELAEKLNSLEGRDYKASADDEALGQDGVKNDKAALTLTRSDGSKVEFKDANGDGQLNDIDYNFDDALAQFNADMAEWEKEMAEAQALVDGQEPITDDAKTDLDNDKDDLSDAKAKTSDIKNDIQINNSKIDQLTFELQSARTDDSKIAHENKKMTRSEAVSEILKELGKELSTGNYSDEVKKSALKSIEGALCQSFHNESLDKGGITDSILATSFTSYQSQIKTWAEGYDIKDLDQRTSFRAIS